MTQPAIDRGERAAWQNMLRRCTPGLPGSEYWGDKGVIVCERWKASFEAFFEDVGSRPSPQHSLDRWPDPYGNYEPNNVRWATAQEQRDNQRKRIPGVRPEARRQIFSALWQWMLESGFRDRRLADKITERSGQSVSARQVARWRKGFGFPSRIEHLQAIDAISGGKVTFQKLIDDKARCDAKARRAKPLLNPDGSDFPAERTFA